MTNADAPHPRPWSFSRSPRTGYPFGVLDARGSIVFTMTWHYWERRVDITPAEADRLAQGWVDAYNAASGADAERSSAS